MRLHPLSQRYGCPTVRRHPRSLAEAFPADYANPIEHHPSPRSWRLNDAFIAALLVGVLVMVLLGGCGGGGAAPATTDTINIVDDFGSAVGTYSYTIPQQGNGGGFTGIVWVNDTAAPAAVAYTYTSRNSVATHAGPGDIDITVGPAVYLDGAGGDAAPCPSATVAHVPPASAVAWTSSCTGSTTVQPGQVLRVNAAISFVRRDGRFGDELRIADARLALQITTSHNPVQ